VVFRYASPDGPDLSSEGNDDEPIEATVEGLILSSDDSTPATGRRRTQRRTRRAGGLSRHFEGARIEVSLAPCPWVLEEMRPPEKSTRPVLSGVRSSSGGSSTASTSASRLL